MDPDQPQFALQPPAHPVTGLGAACRLPCHQTTPPPTAARHSKTAASTMNSSAQASKAETAAATPAEPAAHAAAPPNGGAAQQTAQAAPTPTAAFQGLMANLRYLGTSPTSSR